MQIGVIANIDNARDNVIENSQKVKNVDSGIKVNQDEEHKKSLVEETADKNEVILDNIKFGYNKKSKDFFVKITRGDIERKYPTEDMMKLKAYLLEEFEKSNKS
jgi:uncharacterized FlaG/YvyC family protein